MKIYKKRKNPFHTERRNIKRLRDERILEMKSIRKEEKAPVTIVKDPLMRENIQKSVLQRKRII